MPMDKPVIEAAFDKMYVGNDSISRAYRDGRQARMRLVSELTQDMTEANAGAPSPQGFDSYAMPYQSATVFFAVIDLVAAVGLWLAAPWGAVVWLTSVISMAAVEALFPQIYGGRLWVIVVELALLGAYLSLALLSAREHTP